MRRPVQKLSASKATHVFDFMMKENGDMYCLEANTLPGMTPTSLIPQEAKVLGIDYPDLCEELIRISLKKIQQIKISDHKLLLLTEAVSEHVDL